MLAGMNLPPLRTLFFEDLSVGMAETLEKTVSASDVVGFAQLTGDRNPIHLSEHFAARTTFKTRIAHGLYTASLISAVLGTRLPGPGAIYISQTLNFRAPVKIDDTVTVTVTVAELMPEKSRARLACVCTVDGRGGAGRRGAGEGAVAGEGRPAGYQGVTARHGLEIGAGNWGRKWGAGNEDMAAACCRDDRRNSCRRKGCGETRGVRRKSVSARGAEVAEIRA